MLRKLRARFTRNFLNITRYIEVKMRIAESLIDSRQKGTPCAIISICVYLDSKSNKTHG
jgi:hypothetical protein